MAETLLLAAVEAVPESCPRCHGLVRVEIPVDPMEPRRWVCSVGHGGTIGLPDLDAVRRPIYPRGRCQRCGEGCGRQRFCPDCRRTARAALNERG